jgi:CRISPR-associated protein Cmr3
MKYLIRLTPHEKFFFGGSRTLGETNENYLVTSMYFPQQTALLGFIRYQLLLQCNDTSIFDKNKIQNSKEASKLIGEKSFSIGDGFNFGKIKSISPMFIEKEDVFYFPCSKEYQFVDDPQQDCPEIKRKVFLDPEVPTTEEGSYQAPVKIENYNPKVPISDMLMDKCRNIIHYEDVFVAHKQTGIKKSPNGQTQDNAFFVQTYWKMKKSVSFAFIVELEEAVLKSREVVVFGSEQQTFRMDVKEFFTPFEELTPIYQKSTYFDKLVLLSDAYVEQDVMKKSVYAISETIPFRVMKTSTSDIDYSKKFKKTDTVELYKKGSVFYGDVDEIAKCFDIPDLKSVGYNHYKIVRKKNSNNN